MALIPRREFLTTISVPIGAALLDRGFDSDFAELRANLLEMINEERAVAKVPVVKTDELAARVATAHATEMAAHQFASHWGRDGFKPYHRYSFAGGVDATQENISAADNTWSNKLSDLKQDTSYLHLRMYQETPPNDGHRRTILAPQHTHVGIGIALDKLRLRIVEVFVARYVDVKPIARVMKSGSEFVFGATMLNREHTLSQIDVLYEPSPKAPEMDWLREARSYALPEPLQVLRPKVPPPYIYSDRTRGEIDIGLDGRFSVPVTLSHDKPGIYTLVAWIKRKNSEKAFPATEVCVRAE